LDCETHAVVANVDITWCLCPPGQLLAAQWSDATYGLADEGDPYIYKLRAGPLMRLPVEATAAPLRATVVADRLPMTVGMRGQLVDACGRVVRELLPGENDVSEVAPGVYFVREWPALLMRDSVTTRRVVIVH
jgi:hypothetical protein